MAVCLGEAERWPEEKELNTEIKEFAPTESGQAPFTEKKKPSDKEIENKKKETDEEKNGPALTRLRGRRLRSGQRSGDGFEAGFFADGVERTDGRIAGEVSAENGISSWIHTENSPRLRHRSVAPVRSKR